MNVYWALRCDAVVKHPRRAGSLPGVERRRSVRPPARPMQAASCRLYRLLAARCASAAAAHLRQAAAQRLPVARRLRNGNERRVSAARSLVFSGINYQTQSEKAARCARPSSASAPSARAPSQLSVVTATESLWHFVTSSLSPKGRAGHVVEQLSKLHRRPLLVAMFSQRKGRPAADAARGRRPALAHPFEDLPCAASAADGPSTKPAE